MSKHLLTELDPLAERILEAALQLLTERGYKGATTAAIAQRAGVAELTLFRHFGNKAALVKAACHRSLAAMEDLIPEPSGDVEADLLAFATRYLEHFKGARERKIFILPEIIRHPELRGDEAPPQIAAFRRRQNALIAHYQALGQLKPGEPSEIGMDFIGPLLSRVLMADLWGDPTRMDVARYVRHFLTGWHVPVSSLTSQEGRV
ncbi:DNA-binding transcriptional repressor AcrR [compost metagenome]